MHQAIVHRAVAPRAASCALPRCLRQSAVSPKPLWLALLLALLLFGAATAMLPSHAFADGGAGGTDGNAVAGGAGGAGFAGASGSAAGGGSFAGGGGGAAGGGTGGNAGSAGAEAGLGGTAGATGAAGSIPNGGGGGGGGGNNGASAASLTNGTALTGGGGGIGGAGTGLGGGGGGGAGGYGAIVTGTGASSNSSTISGGNGGGGGIAGASSGTNFGGNGGAGGVGVQLTSSGASFTNTGTVTGGNGGTAGSANGGSTSAGSAGAGGAGIVGSGISITNSNSISGGLGGGGGARADAIQFTGGSNTLTLQTGSSILGNISVNGGGSLTFNQSTAQTLSNTITGSGSVIQSGSGALTLDGTNTYTGGTTVSSGTLVVGGIGALSSGTLTMQAGTTLSFSGSFLPENNIVINGDPNINAPTGTTQVLSGTISDGGTPGDLNVSGGGKVELAGANTYSGGTTICGTICGVAGGSTIVEVTNSIPGTSSSVGTGTVTLDGGTFQAPFNGAILTFNNPLSLTANGGVIDADGNRLTFSGNITDAAGPSGTLTFITSVGAGNPQTILSGNNSYTGTSNIVSGTVLAGSTTGLSSNSAFQVNTGATLDLNGFSNTIKSLADGTGGGGTVQNSTGTAATLTISGAGGSTTFSGLIQDLGSPLSLVKAGSSTQVLSGANLFTGGTTVSGGTLSAANATALGSGAVGVASGATLNVNGVTIGNALTLAGSGVGGIGVGGPGALSGTGTAGVSGAITLAGTLVVFGVVNAGDTLTLSGPVGDAGNGVMLGKDGSGTLKLTGANTYTGATVIGGGTLAIAGTGSISSSAALELGASGVTFDITGASNGQVVKNLTGVAGSIINLGSNTLVINDSSDTTMAGVIQDGGGNGNLEKLGAGTLTLSGNNSYAGTTSILAGTLGVGGPSNLGTGSVIFGSGTTLAITGSGTFANSAVLSAIDPNISVASGQTVVWSGVISDGVTSSVLGVTGPGTLVLTAANTYTGGTSISAGALQIGNGGTTGSILGDVSNNSALVFNRSDSLSFAGTISGNGSVTQAGSGILTLSGSSSYGGGTTVASGTLVVGNAAALGTGTVTVASGATLNDGPAFANDLRIAGTGVGGAGALIVSGVGSGASGPSNGITLNGDATVSVLSGVQFSAQAIGESGGSFVLTKAGGGTLIAAAANTYSGGTIVGAGIFEANNTAPFGSGPVTVQSGASLVIDQGLTITNAMTLNGTGVSGNNSANAALVYNAGNGAASPTISLNGPVTLPSDASIRTGSNGFLVNGVISGAGGLTVLGSGQLVLAANNTYTGATTVSAGSAVAIGTGGTAGSVASQSIGVASGGSLSFLRSDTLTYGGVFSGAGALSQQGTGTLILNGSSDGFTGTTTVQAGTLEIGDASHSSAALGGNVSVAGGATLMGHGTIGGSITNNGTVRPGGSVGVLTVSGNYTQASSAALTIEITPNVTAGPGIGYSQLSVGGTATLAGSLSVLDDPGTYFVGSRYTILTAAGGRTGTFATTTYNPTFAAYITPSITYDANDVFLTLDPTPGTAGPPLLFNGGQEIPDALTAMTAAAQGIGDTVLDDVCGPEARRLLTQGSGCVVRPLAAGYQGEVWMRGLGGVGSLSGNGPRLSFNNDYAGTLIGGGISRGGFTIGAGGGFLVTTLHFGDGGGASQNAGVGFVYGRYAQGPWWLGAMAAYGGGQVDGKRVLPGTGLTANGNRSGNFAIVQTRAAYDINCGDFTFEPRLGLAYLHAGQSGFAENGASLLDLTYAATHSDQLIGRATVRAMRQFSAGSWGLAPWIEAGVQQTFTGLSRGVVVTDGAFSTGVSGVSPAPTAALVGVGISAAASASLDLFVRYQGQVSANQVENAFAAGFAYRF